MVFVEVITQNAGRCGCCILDWVSVNWQICELAVTSHVIKFTYTQNLQIVFVCPITPFWKKCQTSCADWRTGREGYSGGAGSGSLSVGETERRDTP